MAEKERRERFEALIEKLCGHISELKPDAISPIWIHEIDYPLYSALLKLIKKNNRPDWSLVQEMLPKQYAERWTYSRDPEDRKSSVVRRLIALLEDSFQTKDFQTFSPGWIWENDPALYSKILDTIRQPNGTLDWEVIIENLPDKLKERWEPQRGNRNFKKKEAIKRLIAFLEEKQPNEFGPRWLDLNYRGLYKTLLEAARDESGLFDWANVTNLLPENWRQRWNPARKRQAPPKKDIIKSKVRAEKRREAQEIYVNRLLLMLEEKQPETFSVTWISKNDYNLYELLYSNFRLGGKADWKRVISLLPSQWQERFVTSKYDRDSKYSEALIELLKLLEKEKPKSWGAYWIQQRSWTLYQRLLTRVKEGPIIRWSRLLIDVGDEWAQKWNKKSDLVGAQALKSHQEKQDEPTKIEKGYKDKIEVEQALAPFRDRLYTMLSFENEEQSSTREEICGALILLARKGNNEATEQLISLLSPTIQGWIDRYSFMQAYVNDLNRVSDLIKVCIKNYRGKGSFFGYLFTTLERSSRGLKHQMAKPFEGKKII